MASGNCTAGARKRAAQRAFYNPALIRIHFIAQQALITLHDATN